MKQALLFLRMKVPRIKRSNNFLGAKGKSRGSLVIYILSLSGGAGRNAVIYSNTLTEHGHDVTLVAGNLSAENLHFTLDSRITLRVLGVKRNLFAIFRLRRLIRGFYCPRVLVIGPSNMWAFCVASCLARAHSKITLRLADSPESLHKSYPTIVRFIKTLLFSWAIPKASRIIALTRAMEDELVSNWGVSKEKVYYIPNGVRIVYDTSSSVKRSCSTILCVARLEKQKDHVTLLRAFFLLRQKRKCRLILAGDGSEAAALKRYAQDLGVLENVLFLGYTPNVASLYQSASVNVLSSRHEGFPNVLIEALASGCPVVATDCPTGPREVIDSPAIGLLASVGDYRDLAGKIEMALETEFTPQLLKKQAEKFSLAKMQCRIVSLFEGTLE